ncbi:methyltransferase domain-containing protein [Aquiflexum lacus]|uniref:methyltransferase domain-containing protein n=1 Tax=Aquiflexum lacus TaxID=2483805 RepID=UPI00189424D1|nr:methyltransferase domain-containing protein [Aquiflexum lacus]
MSKERLTKCPLCKSGLFLNHKEIKDHAISKENFLLCQCRTCKLIFTNPRPGLEEIGKYYESKDYISHQNKSNNLTNFLYKIVRKITIKSKVKLINRINPSKGKLLDIGCGTGYFLKEAMRQQWKVTGIEPNPIAREITHQKKIKVFESLEEIKKDKKFDIITLFHVLEHIHDLRKTGKSLAKQLKKYGTLIIAVPNVKSFDSHYYDTNWAAYDVPRHLYHFDIDSMERFATEIDMKIVEIKPMRFDSFYVSLLSEKYKNPGENSIKHFISGFKKGYLSNKWAKNNENNYSSLLFVLKKK